MCLDNPKNTLSTVFIRISSSVECSTLFFPVYKRARLLVKALHHVCVTVRRLPRQTASVLMVITAPSMWPRAYWSKSDVPGVDLCCPDLHLLLWPQALNQPLHSRSQYWLKVPKKRGRHTHSQCGTVGHEKGQRWPGQPGLFVGAGANGTASN